MYALRRRMAGWSIVRKTFCAGMAQASRQKLERAPRDAQKISPAPNNRINLDECYGSLIFSVLRYPHSRVMRSVSRPCFNGQKGYKNENWFSYRVGSGVDCSCPRRLYVAVELAHARFVWSANHRLLAGSGLDGAVELFLLSW